MERWSDGELKIKTMMTTEQHDQERQRLLRAARRLEMNEDFLLLRRKLFAMAPPLERTAFSISDQFNPHAAAHRDGACSITRYLLNLSLSGLGQEEETRPAAVSADFVGL